MPPTAFCGTWAKESGDVRLLRWRSYDRDAQSVRFYGPLGQVKGMIAPITATVWGDLNQEHQRALHDEWKQEFVAHEANYLEFFRTEVGFVKLDDLEKRMNKKQKRAKFRKLAGRKTVT